MLHCCAHCTHDSLSVHLPFVEAHPELLQVSELLFVGLPVLLLAGLANILIQQTLRLDNSIEDALDAILPEVVIIDLKSFALSGLFLSFAILFLAILF